MCIHLLLLSTIVLWLLFSQFELCASQPSALVLWSVLSSFRKLNPFTPTSSAFLCFVLPLLAVSCLSFPHCLHGSPANFFCFQSVSLHLVLVFAVFHVVLLVCRLFHGNNLLYGYVYFCFRRVCTAFLQYATFDILKFSFIVRLRGQKQKK